MIAEADDDEGFSDMFDDDVIYEYFNQRKHFSTGPEFLYVLTVVRADRVIVPVIQIASNDEGEACKVPSKKLVRSSRPYKRSGGIVHREGEADYRRYKVPSNKFARTYKRSGGIIHRKQGRRYN